MFTHRYALGRTFIILIGMKACLYAQTTPTTELLHGKWEVVAYAEQGVQVDKKQAPLPQASEVYNHIREQRARLWYGYDPEYSESLNNRQKRALERWAERDSAVEVHRVAEAIAMPYFAVFFADSTLALYNKENGTNQVFFPESRRYTFRPATMSIDIFGPYDGGIPVWQAQVLLLTAERMTLFLPEDGEIVQLEKRPFSLP